MLDGSREAIVGTRRKSARRHRRDFRGFGAWRRRGGPTTARRRVSRSRRILRRISTRTSTMRRLLVGTVMLTSACAALAAAPVLSATGYGPVTFGDRLEVVEKRLGEQ